MKIEDIAKEAGVSKGTVSKVINGYPNISDKLKEKVNRIIEKNNFVPNNSARSLAGKKNKVIGMFVYDEGEISKSSFFQSFVGMVIDECEKNGFSVLVSILNSKEKILNIRKYFDSEAIMGAIMIGMKSNVPEIEFLIEKGYKMSLIDYEEECVFPGTVLVNSNNFHGGKVAANYLIDSNCERLLHITGDLEKFAGVERLRGFKAACEERGRKYEILEGNFSGEYAKKIFEEYISNKKIFPDGIFCSNDETAIPVIGYLKTLGSEVGKDVKIIGFDDIVLASYLTPRLTTINVDLKKMAISSVKYLIKKIENINDEKKYRYEANVSLIKRES